MIEVKLILRDYSWWKCCGLYIPKPYTPATINEATKKGFNCVSKRCNDNGKDYSGYLSNEGEEVKVIWIKLCAMCDVELNEDEESVYSCVKCYDKYAFWTICEANNKKNWGK